MDPDEDACGAAIRDHYEGRTAFEAVERDDGFPSPTGGPAAYFGGYDEWPARVRAGIDRAHGRVLDVGCGAGRHALYLQEQGHDVVGIDVSPGAVEVCRDRGLEAVRERGIGDVEGLDGRFDTVLALGNDFGLVGGRDVARRRLSGLAAVAREDATVVAGSRDPYATDEAVHREYHERNRRRGRLPGNARIRTLPGARDPVVRLPRGRPRRDAPPPLGDALAGPGGDRRRRRRRGVRRGTREGLSRRSPSRSRARDHSIRER